MPLIPESELLLTDEQVVGRYQMEIARWTHDRFVSTVPPLYVLITNQRIILQPQTRKKYEPAVIPGSFIANASQLKAERRGISIRLKSDYTINLFVSGGNIGALLEQVCVLAALPPKRDYQIPLDSAGLQKLISFLEAI